MKCFYKQLVVCGVLMLAVLPLDARSESLKFITLEVAPWAYTDEGSDTLLGIFPDLVREIEKRSGYNIAMTLTPYVRINRELEAGRQDCTMLIRQPERDAITIHGELIFYHPMGVIPKKGIKLSTYDDLYHLRISVLRALKITKRFSLDNKLNKELDTSYDMGLRKIEHGRLDAIAGAIPSIQYLAKKNGKDALLGEPLELISEPIYLQCSHRSQKLHLIDSINQVIRAIKEDSTLDAILDANS
jgi:polar amino acid transport system substrate-binding protein